MEVSLCKYGDPTFRSTFAFMLPCNAQGNEVILDVHRLLLSARALNTQGGNIAFRIHAYFKIYAPLELLMASWPRSVIFAIN